MVGSRPRQQGQDRVTTGGAAVGQATLPRIAAALRSDRREGRRDSDARRRAAQGRRLPPEVGRTFPRHHQPRVRTRRTSCGCRPPTSRRSANPYMNWETVNPLWWVPRGYVAAAHRQPRLAASRPDAPIRGRRVEARDFYDAIEWAAKQTWCSGRVGTSGISYFAMTQWLVAEPEAAVAQGDDPVGRRGRHVPRLRLPRRHLLASAFVVNWYNNHMAHHLLGQAAGNARPTHSLRRGCGSTCATTSTASWYHGRRARLG